MVVPTKHAAATAAVAAAVCHVKVQSCAMQKCQFAFVVALWTVSSEGCNCSSPHTLTPHACGQQRPLFAAYKWRGIKT